MLFRPGTVLALFLASGCASQPVPVARDETGAATEVAVVHPRDAVVSVVGTPFLLAFKTVFCAATLVVAAPVSALAATSESRFGPEIQRSLGDGVAYNCGPPYVLSPYRVVRLEPEPELDVEPDLAPAPEAQPAPGGPRVLIPD